MMTVLFLARFMRRGFGVSVVIDALARQLAPLGVRVVVGCEQHDPEWNSLIIHELPAEAGAVRRLARSCGAACIVAHTSPYFEILPQLAGGPPCWAWEHGDPCPEFFPDDRAERQACIERKRAEIYPRLAGIIAISAFIRDEIGRPDAHVIRNGCDHVPDPGPKRLASFPPAFTGLLTVGTLMRLGEGEAHYKGNHLFLALARRLADRRVPVRCLVMGRGTPEEAAAYRQAGIEVRLNASDEERDAYLRDLDVFFSPSLWEGFNLPLVEAAARGTAAIAFDTGAHPEVTPLLARDVDDVATLVDAYDSDRGLLLEHSARCHSFVRSRFSWAAAAARFLAVVRPAGCPG